MGGQPCHKATAYTEEMRTDTDTSGGIRIHDLIVWEDEDIAFFWMRSLYDFIFL
jgi:hypothetical protein